MALPFSDFRTRAAAAVMATRKAPQTMRQIRAEVAAIMAAHEEIPDDALSREILTVIVWEKLNNKDPETKS